VVFAIGSLLLIRRVIRKARRVGLFTEATAARTRHLGWFLLVMTGLWPFVAAAGRGVVVAAAVRDESWTDQLLSPGISIALVVVSFGVLTFARILRRAVPLQDDVNATV
jgi:Ni/Fe-hydrogenase subunit HybB-like protein